MSKIAAKDDIAARLREARSRVFESAAEAARALDMKPVTVRAHENAQNGIGPYDLERYARRYGVDVAWLLTGQASGLPRGMHHVEMGEVVEIIGQLQDGAWLPMDPDSDTYPMVVAGATPSGGPELTIFTDPRFPAHKIEAFRVVSRRSEGEYPNNTIVFAYPAWEIGHRHGDHVVIVRERGDFCEWTLRKVVTQGMSQQYVALTSDDPPFEWSMNRWESAGYATFVQGTVVGSLTRREVYSPTVEDLALEAASERKMAARARSTKPKE